uniref:Tail protein n=1 Tax=viral metagenome TaxID=1070528 RepID=A0A6M3LC23_9ZZZZ
MANEIKLTLTGSVVNGDFTDDIKPGALQVTQAAQGMQSQIVTVTSSAAVTISTTNVGTLGWLYARNLDATNWVTWGPQSSTGGIIGIGRLEISEWAALRISPGTTIMALASTTGAASCKVLFKFYED